MKITSVYYEKNFPTQEKFIFEKIGLTSTVEEGEDYRQVFEELKTEVHSMHHQNQPKQVESKTPAYIAETKETAVTQPQAQAIKSISHKKETAAQRAERLKSEISTVTSMSVLQDVYGGVILKTYPEIKEAYDLKIKELTNA
jgi:hypothetical protein